MTGFAEAFALALVVAALAFMLGRASKRSQRVIPQPRGTNGRYLKERLKEQIHQHAVASGKVSDRT